MFFRHFLNKYAEKFQKQLPVPSEHLMEAAMRYPWPGNLRELENFVKAEGDKCIADANATDLEYDSKTEHGATQGATLR